MKFKFWQNKYLISGEEKEIRKKDRYLLILSGIMLGISFPPFPFPFQLFFFIGLVPYFFVIEKRKTLIEINQASYLTFFVFSVITLYWVGSWQKNTDPFLMISGILLLFVNPLFLLIPSTLYYFSRKIFSNKISLFLFPFFWVAYEYAYMLTDLSFPWLTFGNGLSHFTSFIQIADVIGALGLSFIIILINILIFYGIKNYKSKKKNFIISLSAAIIIFLLILTYGFNKLSNYKLSDRKITVGLIQPNINPWNKWEAGNLNDFLDLYLNLSQQAINNGAVIILWPETAFPVYLLSGGYYKTVDSIYNFIKKNDVSLLTGMPNIIYYHKNDKIPDDAKYSENIGYFATYNAILLFSPDTRNIQHYGKMKLVPFGEHVPFSDQFPFLGSAFKWGVGLTGWNVGKDTTVFKLKLREKINDNFSNKKDSLKIAGLVCYESIYPVFVSEFVRRGAELIAVVTNDSWYGKLSGPYQHKEISVLRAVENRRSVVRAANGGISCIIDPLGRTQVESKMLTKTFIAGDIILQTDETFFTKHAYLIPVSCMIFSILIIIIFFIIKVKFWYKKKSANKI